METLFVQASDDFQSSTGEMRVLAGDVIGSHRPQVISERNERELGFERTWWVLRDLCLWFEDCVQFSWLHWFVLLGGGWMKSSLEAGEWIGCLVPMTALLYFLHALK